MQSAQNERDGDGGRVSRDLRTIVIGAIIPVFHLRRANTSLRIFFRGARQIDHHA